MRHLKRVGETYFQHMAYCVVLACVLFVLLCITIIHAIYPNAYENTVSKFVCNKLYPEMKRRGKHY